MFTKFQGMHQNFKQPFVGRYIGEQTNIIVRVEDRLISRIVVEEVSFAGFITGYEKFYSAKEVNQFLTQQLGLTPLLPVKRETPTSGWFCIPIKGYGNLFLKKLPNSNLLMVLPNKEYDGYYSYSVEKDYRDETNVLMDVLDFVDLYARNPLSDIESSCTDLLLTGLNLLKDRRYFRRLEDLYKYFNIVPDKVTFLPAT